VDYVFYEAETSQLHREHIILHELGHLLCEHQPTEVLDEEVVAQLLPDLNPAVVYRVLGRTTYTAIEEQEAEMLASLVRGRVEHDLRTARKLGVPLTPGLSALTTTRSAGFVTPCSP